MFAEWDGDEPERTDNNKKNKKKVFFHINFNLDSTTNWIIIPEELMWDDISSYPMWSYHSIVQSNGNKIAHYAAPDSL